MNLACNLQSANLKQYVHANYDIFKSFKNINQDHCLFTHLTDDFKDFYEQLHIESETDCLI